MTEIALPPITVTVGALGDIVAEMYAPQDELAALLASDAGVAPDMLLLIADARLRDMDDQIQSLMTDMNNKSAAAAAVSDHLALLRDALTAMTPLYGPEGRTSGDPASLRVTFRGEEMSVNELASLLNGLGVETAGALSIDQRSGLQNLIDGANEDLRDINSGNEMAMIRLQSAMQNRTTIISATTNLMKSIDEGSDAVVANLR